MSDAPGSSAGSAGSVVLVGFMGAGKSGVGKAVARTLGVPFIDSDDVITANAGPIPAIFAEQGEAAFRALEAEVVLDVLSEALRTPRVVALGGGSVLDPAVRRALSGFASVVWLRAPAAVLWRRVRRGRRNVRPLATDKAAFGALLAEREDLYREVATHTLDNEGGRTAAALAGEVAEWVSAGGASRASRGQASC